MIPTEAGFYTLRNITMNLERALHPTAFPGSAESSNTNQDASSFAPEKARAKTNHSSPGSSSLKTPKHELI